MSTSLSRWNVPILALITVLPACRATGKMLGNEHAEPQAKLEWIARPSLDLPTSDHPTVYLHPFKDAVGADLDLTDALRSGVESAGYTLTSSRSEADYQMVVTLRHFEKAKVFDGGEGAMRTVEGVAPIAGVVGGAYAGSKYGTGGMIAGGILGGAVGLGAGIAARNFSQVNEWDLILDVELNERVEGGFTESRTRDEDTESASTTQRGSEAGSRRTADRREAHVTKEKLHLANTFRLCAIAYQMKMSREEALAVLLPRLPKAIQSVLP